MWDMEQGKSPYSVVITLTTVRATWAELSMRLLYNAQSKAGGLVSLLEHD
jgi:hypothetical protein